MLVDVILACWSFSLFEQWLGSGCMTFVGCVANCCHSSNSQRPGGWVGGDRNDRRSPQEILTLIFNSGLPDIGRP